MTIELGDFPRRRPTIARLDLRPLAQLAPALWAPRAASRPRTTPFASLDLDAFQFDVLLGVSVVKSNVVGAIRPDTCHFSGIELAFALEVRLDPVALARLLRALRAPAAAPRTASRAAPVTPLLPRTPVGIGICVEGFHVLGLEVLIRISVVIPVWRSTSKIGYPEHNCETSVNLHAIEQTQLRRGGVKFDFHTVPT